MRTKSSVLPPKTKRILEDFGQHLRLARLRRKFSRQMVAERAGISSSTLGRVEKGEPTVTMGAYLQVMFVLGLEAEIGRLGQDDVMGRKIQDAQLEIKKRAPKRPKVLPPDEQ